MKLIGRLYGQAAIYKWYNHVWGKSKENNYQSTMIQETLPCSGGLQYVKYSGRLYVIE